MKFKNYEELEKYAQKNSLNIIEIYNNEEIPDIEFVEYRVINPENKQRLVYALIDENDVEYYEAQKQLTLTSKYHDWNDTIADRVADMVYHIYRQYQEYDEIDRDEIDDLNAYIEEYNNQVNNINKYRDYEKLPRVSKQNPFLGLDRITDILGLNI